MAETAAGLLRIHAEPETGRLLAAEMCVPAAEHLAHLVALAVERQMTVADMLAMPFYHPVLEEGLRSALRDLSKAVSGTGGSDLSDCRADRSRRAGLSPARFGLGMAPELPPPPLPRRA